MNGMNVPFGMLPRSVRFGFTVIAIAALVTFPKDAAAQLRGDLMAPPQQITVSASGLAGSGKVGDWLNMIPVTMSHSYSMSFGSVGGQYQNLNAYTNHMRFDFSDRMQANLDIAVLHSPFGGSQFLNPLGDSQGVRLQVRNASFSYKFSEKGRIDVCFSQAAPGFLGSPSSGPCGGSSLWNGYGAYGAYPYGAGSTGMGGRGFDANGFPLR